MPGCAKHWRRSVQQLRNWSTGNRYSAPGALSEINALRHWGSLRWKAWKYLEWRPRWGRKSPGFGAPGFQMEPSDSKGKGLPNLMPRVIIITILNSSLV